MKQRLNYHSTEMKQLLLYLFVCLAMPCAAQKAFKPIKAALKDKNYKEAITQINKVRTDSVYKDNLKLCLYNIEANKGLNDAENMKVYLKQSYDTLQLFSSTYHMVKEAVRIDSIENKNKAKGEKSANARLVKDIVQHYFQNLNVAARYHYAKHHYDEAMRYLRVCIDLPRTALGISSQLSDKYEADNAVCYLTSAYFSKQYDEVHRYDSIALGNETMRSSVLNYLSLTAEAQNDTTAYKFYLTTAWQAYPKQTIFFKRLVDYYNKTQQYDEMLRLSEQQLKSDTACATAFLANTVANYELKRYDACIDDARHLLRCDTASADAHYYIGAAYVAKVDFVQLPEKIMSRAYRKALAEQQSYYAAAEPELETYRKMQPEAKPQWAPLLYKVYLALNRGAKFAEIEKQMK